MPITEARMRYRIGDYYATELENILETLQADELQKGFTALPISDPQASPNRQVTETKADETPPIHVSAADRSEALGRLRRLNDLAGGIGRVIAATSFNNKGYLTLVLPVETDSETRYIAVADSDKYGNAVYACATNDVPAVLGYSKQYALGVGAKRFIHTDGDNLEERLIDFITDPSLAVTSIERRTDLPNDPTENFDNSGQIIEDRQLLYA